MNPVTDAVLAAAVEEPGPAYVYDLRHLDGHVRAIRAALPERVGLLHAVKANPDPELLRVIAGHVDGLEVASGGELAHVRSLLPDTPVVFGGPGKTDAELTAALGVHRVHVESHYELIRLNAAARAAGSTASVLLRVNMPTGAEPGAVLRMGGVPSPFGMDPAEADRVTAGLPDLPNVRVVGVHAHLASGFDAPGCARLAETVLDWAVHFGDRHRLALTEVNVGGGMAVDYREPQRPFDWAEYGRLLDEVVGARPFAVLIEPGRSVSAYSGWYVTRVLDVKRSHGEWFAVCAGGTHHLRTPVTKGHDQPLTVLPVVPWEFDWERPRVSGAPVTFVGQLCTPKDVLARAAEVAGVAVGDIVLFGLAGAYAYNISHHDFLMHPKPVVRYV